MAGIDKTYVNDWKTFDEIRNWAINQKIQFKNGQIIELSDYMYYPDLTKEELLGEEHTTLVLWNTPTYIDIWLIRNCPFDTVQNRLKEQYGDIYNQIKNHTSIFDSYKRNGLGKKAKIHFYGIPNLRDKHSYWYITIYSTYNGEPYDFKYNDYDNKWYSEFEGMPHNDLDYAATANLTKKNIVNLIKKWDLPKNTIVKFESSKYFYDFYCTIN